MPSFQQAPVAYSSLLAAIQKEQLGSCKKWGFLPPRCPTFPFCVNLCKGPQSVYFCARCLQHYCTHNNPHIHGISRWLGPMLRSVGHWWSLGLGWVVQLFYSTTQDRNISTAICQDREVPQASLRGESWILDPKIWRLLIKKREALRRFCLRSRHKLSTWPFSIVYHLTNFSATWAGSGLISHDL